MSPCGGFKAYCENSLHSFPCGVVFLYFFVHIGVGCLLQQSPEGMGINTYFLQIAAKTPFGRYAPPSRS